MATQCITTHRNKKTGPPHWRPSLGEKPVHAFRQYASEVVGRQFKRSIGTERFRNQARQLDFYRNVPYYFGMVKEREGFRGITAHVPEVVWQALEADAEARDISATQVLTEILRRHYRIAENKIPKRKKAGRKPKRGGSSA